MTKYKRPGRYTCYRCGRSVMAENQIHAGTAFTLVLCEDCKEKIDRGLGEK